jgi:hypothetical protein
MVVPMACQIVKHRIGRAGSYKQRTARQAEWNATYGEGRWIIGNSIDGAFITLEDALESVYYQSYEDFP